MAIHTNDNNDRDVIQTLRTAHQNHTQLNLMADQKANILIGTLVLMFTIVFTRLLTLTVFSNKIIIPLVVFIVLELVPIVLTILVLIPRNIRVFKNIAIEDMPNPLFFGFFTHFSEKQYCDYLSDVLCNNDCAQKFLVKDIYQIGVILKHKYFLLRLAYLFTMVGFIIPIILWLIIFVNIN